MRPRLLHLPEAAPEPAPALHLPFAAVPPSASQLQQSNGCPAPCPHHQDLIGRRPFVACRHIQPFLHFQALLLYLCDYIQMPSSCASYCVNFCWTCCAQLFIRWVSFLELCSWFGPVLLCLTRVDQPGNALVHC